MFKNDLSNGCFAAVFAPLHPIPLLANFNAPPMTARLRLAPLALGWVLLTPWASHAQTDTTETAPDAWWKGLFRPAQEVVRTPASPDGQPANTASDSALGMSNTPVDDAAKTLTGSLEAPRSPGSVTWHVPEGVAALDSLSKAHPAPLQGYRIQIYFGTLNEARSVRAAFRRDHPQTACQLLPLSPNYAVTVGNYRDKWEAQRALERERFADTWEYSLVIPSEIDLPSLQGNTP